MLRYAPNENTRKPHKPDDRILNPDSEKGENSW